MKPTIEHIHEQIETLAHPVTDEPLRVKEDIASLQYEANKLMIRFAFPKAYDAASRAFQRTLVQMLKQELGIPHIVLDYKPQETSPSSAQATKMDRLFPNARFIIVHTDEPADTTHATLLSLAAQYAGNGRRVAIIDLDFRDPALPQALAVSQTSINSLDDKVQPFKTPHGYELISPHLFTSRGRAMAWRKELCTAFVDQALHGVSWHEATDIFLLHLPKNQMELLPVIQKFIPQVKIEVNADERK